MKLSKALLPVVICGVSIVAYAQNEGDSHSEVVDSAGTKTTIDKEHSDKVGLMGTHTTEMKGEKVVDPKGLNNKTKESYDQVTKVERNGDSEQKTTTVDAAGTKRELTTETDTSKNWTGGNTVTTTRTEVVDPKGMMNRQKTEIEEKVVTDSQGRPTSVTRSLNGEEVPAKK